MSLSSPTILITGSSSGVGRSSAEVLARHGYTVFASMRDIAGKNAPVAAELRDLAARESLALHVIELDVTNDRSIQHAVEVILAQTGRLDVLVNNAGFGIVGLTEATSVEQAQRMVDVNLLGVLRVNQAVLPHMRREGSGLVVYISSTSARVVYPFLGLYGATKSAVDIMAEAMHYELFGVGVDSVILQLGGYATEFGSKALLAADEGMAHDYGVAGEMVQGFTAHFSNALDDCQDPRDVGEAIAKLIEQPHGQRPLRMSFGTGSEGLDDLNQPLAAYQRQVLSGMGLSPLLERPELALA